MTRRRLLFVSRSLFPDIGGSETHVHWLARWFAGHGYDVSVMTSPPVVRSNYVHPYHVQYVPELREFDRAAGALSVVEHIFEALRAWRPDVVHVQNVVLALATSLACSALKRTPILVIADHNTPLPRERAWLKGVEPFEVQLAIARHVFTRCSYDAVVAFSKTFYDWNQACGVPRSRLYLIPHGVDTQSFAPGAADPMILDRLGCSDGRPLVLAPGRLVQRKGIGVLVEAFEQDVVSQTKADLVILSSSSTSDQNILDGLSNQIAASPARERIRVFLDALTPEQMPDAYRAARCVVFPSRAEGFGLVGIEALSCGSPLVTCASQGLREFVKDGRTGRVVPFGDVQSLARAIAEVLVDEELRHTLHTGGRALVERQHTLEQQCRVLERLYARLYTRKRRRRRAGA